MSTSPSVSGDGWEAKSVRFRHAVRPGRDDRAVSHPGRGWALLSDQRTTVRVMSATFADRAQALHDRLDTDAPEATTWRPDDPQAGHSPLLIGELTGITAAIVRTGPAAGKKRQIAILRDGEGR